MRKCKNCKAQFEPRFTSLEKYCWLPDCKTIEAMEKLEQLKRMDKRNWKQRQSEMKKANKTSSDYRNDLQKIFNKWVRLRDKHDGCISCGKPFNAKYDAGHYFSVGSYPNLRYNPLNTNGQCVRCNREKHGNLTEYRARLIRKIGQDEFDKLEASRHHPLHITTTEIIELMETYKIAIKLFLSNDDIY